MDLNWQVIYLHMFYPQLDKTMLRAYLIIVRHGLVECSCEKAISILNYLLNPADCKCCNIFRQIKLDAHRLVINYPVYD